MRKSNQMKIPVEWIVRGRLARRSDSRLKSKNDSYGEDAGKEEGGVEQSAAHSTTVPATVNEVSDFSLPRKPLPMWSGGV